MALIYDYFTLGAADNLVAFNDYSNTGAPAIYRVEARYPTKRSITEFDVKLPEGPGIADFQTLLGKEYYIIQGEMYPQNEDGYHAGRRQLRKLADLTTSQADPYSDTGYVPLTWTETVSGQTSPRQLFVKVLYCDMRETTTQGIVQPFQLFCKIKDPEIYGTAIVQAVTGSGSFQGATSGAGYPMKYPTQFGASSGSAGGQAINIGDLAVNPTITITGPVTNPRVTNLATGEYMEVDVVLNSTSDVLLISYTGSLATITLNGNSVYQNKTSGSTFFKLRTGTTNFSLTGSNIGAAAKATLSFLPAWPLS